MSWSARDPSQTGHLSIPRAGGVLFGFLLAFVTQSKPGRLEPEIATKSAVAAVLCRGMGLVIGARSTASSVSESLDGSLCWRARIGGGYLLRQFGEDDDHGVNCRPTALWMYLDEVQGRGGWYVVSIRCHT